MSGVVIPCLDSDNLWASAIARLSDSQKAFIDFDSQNKLEALSELLRYTHEQKERCVGKSWRWKRSNGDVVIVRDLLAKVANWADKFKYIGDTVIQIDPVHGALPWVGVRFLIQTFASDFENYKCVLEGAAVIAEVLCRSLVYEKMLHSLGSHSPAREELVGALIKLYVQILEYLSRVKQYFEDRTLKRIVKSVLQMHADFATDLEKLCIAQQDVTSCSNLVIMQQQIDGSSELKELLRNLEIPMQRWDGSISRIKDMLEDETRARILQWLSPQPHFRHHAQMRKNIMQGSGKWLLGDPLLADWKTKSSSSMIWLHGMPGSGKSKLVSIVIDDLLLSADKKVSPPPVYFYCSRNTAEPGRSHSTEIAASIARQLSCVDGGSILEPAIQEYKKLQRMGFGQERLNLEEIRDLILALLEYYPVATIVLDALDECSDESREELLSTIDYLLQESPTLIKILVSSRHDQNIVSELQVYPSVEISSTKNHSDIAAFVHHEVQVLKTKKPLRSISNVEKIEQLIISTITTNANGMFLWASLQLQTLRELKTVAAIEERVGHLPPKLSDTYDEILEKIKSSPSAADRMYAMNALSLLLCAICPLDVNQFLGLISASCTYQISVEQILDLCCNLVVFDSTSSTFRFTHLSVQEFLEAHPKFAPMETHRTAAIACLVVLIGASNSTVAKRTLVNSGFAIPEETSREAYWYAGMFWCEHCRLADPELEEDGLGSLLWNFISGEKDETSPICCWWNHIDSIFLTEPYQYGNQFYTVERKFRTSASRSGGPSGALIACCFDLPKLMAKLKTEKMITTDTRNLYGNDCRELAALYTSTTTLEILVTDEYYVEPPTAAVAGSVDLAVFLKELHEEPHDDETLTSLETLHMVLSNPTDGHEMLNALLKKFHNRIIVTYELLSHAVMFGSQGTVKLLLENAPESLRIDSTLVALATTNRLYALEIASFLCLGTSHEILITNEVVVAAARNYHRGEELLTTILIVGEIGGNPPITTQILESCIDRASLQTIVLLLDRCVISEPVTDRMISQAIKNYYEGKEILEMLHKKHDIEANVTERMLVYAAGHGSYDTFVCLTDILPTTIKPSSEMLMAASQNLLDEIDVLDYLLSLPNVANLITNEMMEVAVKKGSYDGIALLLKASNGRFAITHNLLLEAAKNRAWGNEILYLLQEKDPTMMLSSDIINAAIQYGSEVTVGRLIIMFEKAGFNLPLEAATLAAAKCQEGPESMSLLLTRFGAAVSITPEVLHTVAENVAMGHEISSVLGRIWGQ